MRSLNRIKHDEIQKIVTKLGIIDGLIVVKNGMITIEELFKHGEITTKIQDSKIMQIDKTEKIRI
ncbi:hypothetical protein CN941_18420 [Bacillus cereus]|nr:hypothetical protein COL94_25390 [Bacillus wiedmannii]PGM39152.1 hypothetical protein CN941_18420 [Bacillus cereus]